MATVRVMKLIDEKKRQLECKVCGTQHIARLGDNGEFFRGSWQCMHRCELPTKTETRAYNGRSSKWIEPGEMKHSNG